MNKYVAIALLGATVVSTALALDMGVTILSDETKPAPVLLLADTGHNGSVHYKSSEEPLRPGLQQTFRNALGSESEAQPIAAPGYWI